MKNSYNKPMVEFIVWNNCNNNCLFCWQKHLNKPTKFLTNKEKVESISKMVNFLVEDQFQHGSDVLMVGGEIFDDLDVELISILDGATQLIGNMMKEGKIRNFYINTNLLYKNLMDLSTYLQIFFIHDIVDRLKFTTSYDLYGRFKTPEDEARFLWNLRVLIYSYPNLRIVVNMILTKQFCKAVINKEFNVKEFCDKYKVQVNTIPYITLSEDMRPSKDLVMKTLLEIDKQIPGYFRLYTENFDFEQEKILYEYDKEKGYELCTSELNKCGHNINFTKVFEDKSCFICNCKELLQVL